MKTMKSKLFSIGRLAKMSGITVRTIRFYSDEGLLPPAAISESGYRYYSREHLARLEAIRALRDLDFDLTTIAQLLKEPADVAAAIELHLQAIETKLRALRRQRALLRIAKRKKKGSLNVLQHAHTLAKLDELERRLFIRDRIDTAIDDINIDPQWRQWFLDALVFDPPDGSDEKVMEAWLELAQLVSDTDFLASLQKGSFWEKAAGHYDHEVWMKALGRFTANTNRAIDERLDPHDEEVGKIIDTFLAANAAMFGRQDDENFEAWLLEEMERSRDPRAERFWELIDILRGGSGEPSPIARAYAWLIEMLRIRAR